MDANESLSRIIRLPEVKHRTGLSRSSIYAGIKAGTFPQHISLGARAVGWTLDSILAWMADRAPKGRPQ